MTEDAKVLPAWEAYRPSNGTEGLLFQEAWCARCAHDLTEGCPILRRTLFHEIGDPEYPVEWIRQANDTEWPGTARCTAFVPMEV